MGYGPLTFLEEILKSDWQRKMSFEGCLSLWMKNGLWERNIISICKSQLWWDIWRRDLVEKRNRPYVKCFFAECRTQCSMLLLVLSYMYSISFSIFCILSSSSSLFYRYCHLLENSFIPWKIWVYCFITQIKCHLDR